jgi:hypothetical protein
LSWAQFPMDFIVTTNVEQRKIAEKEAE